MKDQSSLLPLEDEQEDWQRINQRLPILSAKRRNFPYSWVTWITKLITGDDICYWATWFKAHYTDFETVKRPFDSDKWKRKHTLHLGGLANRYRSDGFNVQLEDQNSMKLLGKTGIIAGKPDIIAVKPRIAIIDDAKTGKPRDSNKVQVMLYMMMLRYKSANDLKKIHPDLVPGMEIRGIISYPDAKDSETIEMAYVDREFDRQVREVTDIIFADTPPVQVPSRSECGFCSITSQNCPARISGNESVITEAETDLF